MDYYARIYYEYYHSKKVDLKKTVEFNQKLQWLKVYFHPPILNILADKLPFSRVDFYSIEDKILFGEITFYPVDCRENFYPDKYNKVIGDYITLPKIPKGQKEITESDPIKVHYLRLCAR